VVDVFSTVCVGFSDISFSSDPGKLVDSDNKGDPPLPVLPSNFANDPPLPVLPSDFENDLLLPPLPILVYEMLIICPIFGIC
jgi:hypothetical protein